MEDVLTVQEVMERSSQWLLKAQDESGGWAERPGEKLSALNTAEAVISLLDARAVDAGDPRIQTALDFLKDHRGPSAGADRGAWHKEVGNGRLIPDIVRTAFAVMALVKGGRDRGSAPVKDALEWLLGVQNQQAGDRGWGYSRGSPGAVFPTCLALLALVQAYGPDIDRCPGGVSCKDAIEAGLGFLVAKYRNEDGSFGAQEPLLAAHTIYALLALQAARRCGLGPSAYLKTENEALRWLLRNPDKATRLVEETLDIAPGTKGTSYGFLFMTDSLLIRVLGDSADRRYRGSELARQVLLNLKERWDQGSGGFYGSRVFSWSTAKVLSALSDAGYSEFPVLRPESPQFTLGRVLIFIFALMLTGSVIYLTSVGGFHTLHALFFGFLVIVLLLVYGWISSKTFSDLVHAALRLRPQKEQ